MLDNEKKRHAKTTSSGNAILRSVKGRTGLDKIRNEDVRKELGVVSINDRKRRYRQDWREHVERMEEGRVALWYKSKGRRDPGRPRRRWNSQKPEQANGLILELERRRRLMVELCEKWLLRCGVLSCFHYTSHTQPLMIAPWS
jgi:hypothetical protein